MIEANYEFLEQLTRHEGCILHTYRCPAGKLTIGVGHNLEANPIPDIRPNMKITHERALKILKADCISIASQLDKHISWWRTLTPPRQAVLLNMAFNMGIQGLLGFERTLKAIKVGDYEDASGRMLNSLWAKQVSKRAKELSRQMLTGEWQTSYNGNK